MRYGQFVEVESIPEWRIKPLARVIYSSPFEALIGLVILANAVSIARLTMPNLSDSTRSLLETFDRAAYAIYVVELTLRLASYGRKPWMFFTRFWNVFDFVIVGAAPIFAAQTVIMRLLRLLRLVRIMRFLPEARILVISVAKSLPPLFSFTVLISLLMFLFSMTGHYLFGAALPEQWGDAATAMTSLFILLTLEEFAVYFTDAMGVTWLALPYFLAYILVLVFTVLNILIGIVLNAMDKAREAEQELERSADLLTPEEDRVRDIDEIRAIVALLAQRLDVHDDTPAAQIPAQGAPQQQPSP